jgi:hypothetical protein
MLKLTAPLGAMMVSQKTTNWDDSEFPPKAEKGFQTSKLDISPAIVRGFSFHTKGNAIIWTQQP